MEFVMKHLLLLIKILQQAKRGSLELDWQMVEVLHPGVQKLTPELHYSRSLDARLPEENIVRVEKLTDSRWRAWLADDWSADGTTEALARRLACLTKRVFDADRRKLKIRKRIDHTRIRNRNDEHPTQTQLDANGKPDNSAFIIEALCAHIRRLQVDISSAPLSPLSAILPADGDVGLLVKRNRRFQPATTEQGSKSQTTLSDALQAWTIEARPRVKNLERINRSIRRLIEMRGDRHLNGYTKADIRAFLTDLRQMPRVPPADIRLMPMPVLLNYAHEHPDIETIAPTTVRHYLKDIQLLFNWSIANDLCGHNPANNLTVVDRRHHSELRVPYDLEDLKTIFERSPMYAGCKMAKWRRVPGDVIVKDSVFWFPLFALFTGARAGEIAGAVIDDFKTHDGTWYFDIHAAGDNRHLKTRYADRRIPIHSELIETGFLDYVRQQGTRGFKRVFEEVEGRRNIASKQGLSQAWSVYQDCLGIDDRRKVFHSFRHTFKRACRDAGIEEEVHDALTGNRPHWSGRRYGDGISFHVLANAMQKVRYPGLDLSHLHGGL